MCTVYWGTLMDSTWSLLLHHSPNNTHPPAVLAWLCCLPIHLPPAGGPAGLASAIMFAKRGCKVTVAERNSEVTYSDPDRSYVYAIDGRGRQFTDKYDITPKLADASVDALDVSVTRVFPSGKSVTRRQVIKDERRLVYWLPRSRWARVGECAHLDGV